MTYLMGWDDADVLISRGRESANKQGAEGGEKRDTINRGQGFKSWMKILLFPVFSS